jgi:hypothetical protein
MTSLLLKRKIKCQLYETIILRTLLCGSESWTVSQAHGALVEGSERKILRTIYGAVQIDGVW